MVQALRLLLFPLSLLYTLIVMVRNLLFDIGLIDSRKFEIPVISIGNLVAGGTGKSPMTEYLVRMLKDQMRLAVLSRGYGRNTRGFVELDGATIASAAGDEPVQMKQKFPEITVAVCEDRVKGIEQLETDHDIILLDDAFQHRQVSPGLSILLFDYGSVFKTDFLLPAGNLREPLSERKRADILVITKTPQYLSTSEQQRITARIKPFAGQEIFFSWLSYGQLLPLYGGHGISLDTIAESEELILLTGIANPKPLVERLRLITRHIIHHAYPDHHTFSTKNILKLASEGAAKKIITTEKDAQRLKAPQLVSLLKNLEIYYLPVEAKIHSSGEPRFKQIVSNYVFRKHS